MRGIVSSKEIGERIKSLRIAKGLTQSELSSRINISRSNYSQVERGTHLPTFEALINISREFGKSYEWILHGTECKSHIQEKEGISNLMLIDINTRPSYIDAIKNNSEIAFPTISLPLPDTSMNKYRAFEVDTDCMSSTSPYDILIGKYLTDYENVDIVKPCMLVTERDFLQGNVMQYNHKEKLLSVYDKEKRSNTEVNTEYVLECWQTEGKFSTNINHYLDEFKRQIHIFETMVDSLRMEVNKLKKG
jgi:transcriptional regulator with XRE-family HTH domain